MSRPGRALIKFGQQYKDHYSTGRTKCLGTLEHGELWTAESRVITQSSPKSVINNSTSTVKKKWIFAQFGMLSKSKEPETLLTEDISCSLVLDEAFLQHGLEEKNVKIESPATKRKITLNIQIQLWITLFFHLKATNDLLKKMSVPMLETFQRECVEPPPIRISNVKHKAHSFTLSIKWKQPTYYSVRNWEAHFLKILRRIHGWSKQAPVPEVKQRHGTMPKDRIWCKHIMEMKSQSSNKYLQSIPVFLGVTSCNGLSNRLASCLHTEPCATKCQEEEQSAVSSCTQWWEHRARRGVKQSGFSALDQQAQCWGEEVGWARTADFFWPCLRKLALRRLRGSWRMDGQRKVQGPVRV